MRGKIYPVVPPRTKKKVSSTTCAFYDRQLHTVVLFILNGGTTHDLFHPRILHLPPPLVPYTLHLRFFCKRTYRISLSISCPGILNVFRNSLSISFLLSTSVLDIVSVKVICWILRYSLLQFFNCSWFSKFPVSISCRTSPKMYLKIETSLDI